MYQMSGDSRIMLNDEQVLIRRQALTLGGDTVVVDGKRIQRGYEEFLLRCNVQPVSGAELLQVPEGDRYNEMLWLYVADRERPLQVNDLVFRPADGWYQVQNCEGWGSYTRAQMQRVDVGPLRANLTGPRPGTEPDLDLLG